MAQRIKRLASIEDKLARYKWLKLSAMQDIAGCRVIVNSVASVYALVHGYRSYRGHSLDDEDDYIRKPKPSGYRGYHLIFQYENPLFAEYGGLKVEMQLRSNLQHCWATAVEIVDIYLREGLKANRGSADWRRFFALMATAIALREDCRPIPRTPRDSLELVTELREYVEKLDVLTRLKAFGESLNIIEGAKLGGIKYVILVLDPSAERTLQLYGYRASDLEGATDRLALLERYRSATADSVLVSVSDANQLRRAYPNYFLDTNVFLDAVKQAIS